MTDPLETFVTNAHYDYKWPFPKPIILKPAQPPMNTGNRLFVQRPEPDDCICDAHAHKNNKNRYKYLAEKERRINDELIRINNERVNLTSAILESPCEPIDETMKTVYKTDYEKRGLPANNYRKLMASTDSKVPAMVSAETFETKDGYRDPTRFRFSAIERPDIQPAKPCTLVKVPETFSLWAEPFSGRSEYMDTISKMGLSNMKNRQQFLEPLPSSRRRFGDCKL